MSELFKTGKQLASHALYAKMFGDKKLADFVIECWNSYQRGEFGQTDINQKRKNWEQITDKDKENFKPDKIYAEYVYPHNEKQRLVITTLADRSETAIFFKTEKDSRLKKFYQEGGSK